MNTLGVLLLALMMQLLSIWVHPVRAQTLARIQQSGQVSLKPLRGDAPQQLLPLAGAIKEMR